MPIGFYRGLTQHPLLSGPKHFSSLPAGIAHIERGLQAEAVALGALDSEGANALDALFL